MAFLEVNHLKKVYTTRFGGNKAVALKDVNFSVEKGDYTAIMGESGSGKTTLLNILASVDRPTDGDVLLNGKNTISIKESDLAKFRREHLGLDFNLLDTLSLEDNIYLPLVLAGKKYKDMEPKLKRLAPMLGISKLLKKYPYEVSGGEKQRTAVARAMITEPDLLLADEPTGALDSRSSEELLHIFTNLHKSGQTILMVTHSVRAASYAGRVLFIKDGEIYHQLYRGNLTNDEMYKRISDTLTVLLSGGDFHENCPFFRRYRLWYFCIGRYLLYQPFFNQTTLQRTWTLQYPWYGKTPYSKSSVF